MTPLQSTWGWLIAWYLFLAGVGAGAYIVSVLADFLGFKSRLASKIGVALGAPLVLVGTILLFLDLGQPMGFVYIFNNPSSMITIGSAIHHYRCGALWVLDLALQTPRKSTGRKTSPKLARLGLRVRYSHLHGHIAGCGSGYSILE